MRKIFILLIMCALTHSGRLTACGQNPQPNGAEIAAEDTAAGDDEATSATARTFEGAHIAFAENVHDFGDVARRGGDVTKDFEFVNDGTEPLVVTGVKISCTCIKAEYSKRPVPVGGKGSVRLIYEPHKMEAGTFYRVVEVHSNSTEGVSLLTVHGHSVDVKKIK